MPLYLRRIVDTSCFILACWLGWRLKHDAGYGWVVTILIAAAVFLVSVPIVSTALGLIALLRLKIFMWIFGIKKPRH
jgi:energy-converting hydrogenase Eha subunit B